MARRTRNSAGLERSLKCMRDAGKIEEVDDALVALARHLADALDSVDPVEQPAQTASLARAQLATLRVLMGGADDDPGLDLAAVLAAMGDTPDT